MFKNDSFGLTSRLYPFLIEGPFTNTTQVWRKSVKTEVTTAGETSTFVESLAARISSTSSIIDTFQIGKYYNEDSIFLSFLLPKTNPMTIL